MMNLKKLTPSGGRKAFTLVEILIVIIVIGILAGLMLVNANAAIETSKRAVCVADRRTIKSAWHYQDAMHRGQFQSNIAAAMADFPKAQPVSVTSTDAVYTGICQDGGAYTIKPDDNRITIECSIAAHNEAAKSTGSTASKYEEILNISKELFPSGGKWPNGTILLEELIKRGVLGDKYVYENNNYYVKADIQERGEIFLFAYDKPYDSGSKWRAIYIYDDRTDKWYKTSGEVNIASGKDVFFNAIDGNSVIKDTNGNEVVFTEAPDFQPF